MVTVEHWSVFPRGPEGGNPCPVVTDVTGLRPAQMMAIAAHYRHESVFVTGAGASGVQLRYFVPHHEMRMCVHGTIAAITTLLRSGAVRAGETTVLTASGEYRVSWGDGEPPEVTVEQGRPSFGPPELLGADVMAALGLPEESAAAAAPVRAVSVSRPKVIVPVCDAEAVHAARPDPLALRELCRLLDTTGAYVFAPHPDGRRDHFVARQFPVGAGYREDPGTGVAAAALAAYLADGLLPFEPAWARITIDQGDAMGRPSRLRAAALTGPTGITRTSVTGHAVRTGQEDLDLDAILPNHPLPEPELR